jgi:hypothetical protein
MSKSSFYKTKGNIYSLKTTKNLTHLENRVLPIGWVRIYTSGILGVQITSPAFDEFQPVAL